MSMTQDSSGLSDSERAEYEQELLDALAALNRYPVYDWITQSTMRFYDTNDIAKFLDVPANQVKKYFRNHQAELGTLIFSDERFRIPRDSVIIYLYRFINGQANE